MMRVTGRVIFGVVALMFVLGISQAVYGRPAGVVNDYTLRYDKPAGPWEEALPIGNGSMGAMIFGGAKEEHLQFNEDTLWTNGPTTYQHDDAADVLPTLRQLLFDGKQREAEELAMKRFMSEPLTESCYQPFADVRIAFDGHDEIKSYQRSLDITKAVAQVDYQAGGVGYHRQYFASYPDKMIVMSFQADQPGSLTFKLRLTSEHETARMVKVDDHTLAILGRVTNRAGNGQESKLRFEARLAVKTDGGELTVSDDGIAVSRGNRVELRLVAATSYVNYNDVSADPAQRCQEKLATAASRSYDQLYQRHVKDYQSLFNRVSLDLGRSDQADKPTNQRIKEFKGSSDPAMVSLYFQYGRYLLISSSRPGSQPANLQGLWNKDMNPAWGSKYTVNINTEMNYWPAEKTNLSECAEPLFDMIEDCSHTGGLTAKNFYNCPGWVVHHNTDIWRGSAPINHSNHGIWVTGGAWLSQNLWWHYAYTRDETFLRERAYPLLKGLAMFFSEYLIEDPRSPEKWLISGPSNSPEQGGLVMGPTMDHQIIRELFSNVIEASEILNVDADLRGQLKDMRSRIAPNQIGKHGQLQEWLEDVDDPENTHRHVSHLWGLFPGTEINRFDSPKFWAAARKSLEFRGDGGTGWSMGWKINLWAHLADGDHAFMMLSNQLTPERTLPNLFDTHPPFQIDGNFGATSGITEMIMQSSENRIELLPALPGKLSAGRITGLRAEGGFQIDIEWTDGKLTQAKIVSLAGQPAQLCYNGKIVDLKLAKGEEMIVESSTFK